ncbi:hypothetical protein NZNM25_01500 [Nitrosopumilus zosterae]|uniref:Uncharacterized protein n=1 Tax=Nitrosopumilus zosterae TaxID=718286 RepID=A0A2S2KNZ5_9ARCH|nr:hypothetical protein [Nitrosopumilus zosterae]BDQ31146.1 hypothetical protein NZOSNM25_001257 [Nitrosopumilus zosterae]GBH33359.1 hypothetical protein NZNM25_01500 [Nitrosopumilus zosterae]
MFSPDEFLTFVKTIRRKNELQTEAGVRTALNRCYFSSLVKAKNHLESKGNNFSNNEEMHKEIIEKVKEANETMGDKLNTLLEMRNKADYDMEFNGDSGLISPIYGMSKSFNDKVSSKL